MFGELDNFNTILSFFIGVLAIFTTFATVVSWKIRKEKKYAISEFGVGKDIESLKSDISSLKQMVNDMEIEGKLTHNKIIQEINDEIGKIQHSISNLSNDFHELKGYVKGIEKK